MDRSTGKGERGARYSGCESGVIVLVVAQGYSQPAGPISPRFLVRVFVTRPFPLVRLSPYVGICIILNSG